MTDSAQLRSLRERRMISARSSKSLIMMLRMMIVAPMMCIGGIMMALVTDRQLALVIVAVAADVGAGDTIIARKGMPCSSDAEEAGSAESGAA